MKQNNNRKPEPVNEPPLRVDYQDIADAIDTIRFVEQGLCHVFIELDRTHPDNDAARRNLAEVANLVRGLMLSMVEIETESDRIGEADQKNDD